MKQLTTTDLDALTQQASDSPRRRANHNLHATLADPIQRLAIAMEPDTVILPHRHAATWELLMPLRGRFAVLHFDDAGRVVSRVVLGENCSVQETPVDTLHAVLSLDPGGVIFEVKHGPYRPFVEADFASWAPSANDATAVAHLLAWYACAQSGDRYLSCPPCPPLAPPLHD
jgi:cupin fold WbuC family metalloprotein